MRWPADRVAAWVSARPRPVVMGWPFNGTRRCYLTHRLRNPEASGDYLTTVGRRQAELHRMVFAHGVGVLAAPHFGTSLLRSGQDYARYALGGLLRLAEDYVYKEVYAAGLRLRFYGDYTEKLGGDREFREILDVCALAGGHRLGRRTTRARRPVRRQSL